MLLQPLGGGRDKRTVVPDLDIGTIEMLRAQHITLRENGSFFIGWHATDTETARALLGGGRYVPPERTGYMSDSEIIISMRDSNFMC